MTDQTPPAAPLPDATIQQVNIGYNSEQDRLLLRIGLSDDTELLLWLTHRIAKQLWQLLNSEAHLPTADSIQADALPANAVAQFKQEAQATEALQKMDFATQYQPRKTLCNDGALLATKLKLTGESVKHLEVACLEGITVGMNLQPVLILAMCNMLQLSVKNSGWDLGAKLMVQQLASPDEIANAATDVSVNKNKVLH